MPKLYIYPQKGDSFHFPLGKKKMTLGRSADNDIPLADPFCSKQHAFIVPKKDEYFIQDNESKNGIFLNGHKVLGEEPLKKGDEILLGSTRIVFDLKLDANVEVTDIPSTSANINTILHVKDILKKPQHSTTIKSDSPPLDLEALRAEHQDFSVISEVSQALLLHKPLNELLEHVMDLICENLQMDRGILMLQEGHPGQLVAKVVRINNQALIHQKIQVSQSIINTVVEKDSSVLISDTLADTRFKSQESILKLNIHSAMCVPLWNNKEIIGIIYSDRISMPSPFTQSDLRLLTLMSNLAAVKIENARLIEQALEKKRMERELELACQIQKELLPRQNPDIPKYDIAGRNIPCQQVGGDYYDFIPIDSDRLGITIADVSGKGVSSSLLMASLRAALHSELHVNQEITQLAGKLNNFVYDSSSINAFITFFLGALNYAQGDIQFVNAGHNPPILLKSSGKIERLEGTGFCLGMFPEKIYEAGKKSLEPGDILLLFTDGFTENRNRENQEYQESGLISALKKHSTLPGAEIIDALFKDLELFSDGTDYGDDRTLVVIKRTG